MRLDQNIKDVIKATVILLAIIVLVVVSIEVYIAATTDETGDIHRFLTLSANLHDDINGDEVREDILNLIDDMSASRAEEPEEIEKTLTHGLYMMRAYKERFYVLVSPTDEMRSLKESLIEEGGLFLGTYHYLKEAWEGKKSDNDAAYSSNMEKAVQYLDDAVNIRNQNSETLEWWQEKIEEELSG